MSISKKRLEEIKNFKTTDFSDCPILTDEQMAMMKPCHLINQNMWRPRKQVLNVRVDADVLEKMRSSGSGWQSRLNDLLRNAVATGKF